MDSSAEPCICRRTQLPGWGGGHMAGSASNNSALDVPGLSVKDKDLLAARVEELLVCAEP